MAASFVLPAPLLSLNMLDLFGLAIAQTFFRFVALALLGCLFFALLAMNLAPIYWNNRWKFLALVALINYVVLVNFQRWEVVEQRDYQNLNSARGGRGADY